MNLKQISSAVAAVALLAASSVSASAATVLDGWQLVTPKGTTIDIGRLNLSGGIATVYQEIDANNQAFVGSRFSESGQIFALGFQTEDTPGAGDGSDPANTPDSLKLKFSNVRGTVTQLNVGGGFHYTFDSGSFVLSGLSGNYASGSIIGLGGNASSTAVIGGFNGDSTILSQISTILNAAFDMRDNMGVSLKPELASGNVLFEAVTNNNLTNVLGIAPCDFDTSKRCAVLRVASGGDAYLVRQVPEPGTLALTGFALLGLGMARRRRQVK